MKLTKKGKTIIIITGIFICLMAAAVLALPHVLPPGDFFLRGSDNGEEQAALSVRTPAPAPPTEPEQPPSPTAAPLPPLPDVSAYRPQRTGDDYTTIRMDPSDIHRGHLLLVNGEHRYDIPGDLDLMPIVDARVAQFRLKSFGYMLRSTVMEPLNEMMQSFNDDTGRSFMYIISAFRSYNTQQFELNDAIYLHGREAALMLTKEPGFSEHHTGLAFDLAIFIDGEQYSFDFYDSTRWFSRNAYKHGFILRYPRNKVNITNTMYEPWHYRYVGLPHSYIMFDNDWVLEEYVEKIKGYTQQEPLKITYSGTDYEIFFTESTSVTIPANAKYDISGNNTDGFIVTIYDRYDRLTNIKTE